MSTSRNYFLPDSTIELKRLNQSKRGREGVQPKLSVFVCAFHCRPGFESQAHHLCFYQIIFELRLEEKTKIKKEVGMFN